MVELNTQVAEEEVFCEDGRDYFLRARDDLLPQYRDSLCIWGGGADNIAALWQGAHLRVTTLCPDDKAVHGLDGEVVYGSLIEPPFADRLPFNLGYCVGVMEHVPAVDVIKVLRTIKRHTHTMVWFRIKKDCRKNASWWAAAFAAVFPRVSFSTEETHYIVRAYCESKEQLK